MTVRPTTAKIVANRIRTLIDKAPAGGEFHDVVQSAVTEHHKDDSASFVANLLDGKAYKITITRL